MPTRLDQLQSSNAGIAAQIADVQAKLPGLQVEIAKAILATPGMPEAVCASLVRDAQKPGGKPVPLPMLDSVLAAEGVDISRRIEIKELMYKRGQVRP